MSTSNKVSAALRLSIAAALMVGITGLATNASAATYTLVGGTVTGTDGTAIGTGSQTVSGVSVGNSAQSSTGVSVGNGAKAEHLIPQVLVTLLPIGLARQSVPVPQRTAVFLLVLRQRQRMPVRLLAITHRRRTMALPLVPMPRIMQPVVSLLAVAFPALAGRGLPIWMFRI